MRAKVEELVAFYGSREGQLARRLVNAQLRQVWPDVRGLRLAGVGFAQPFLGPFEEAERAVVLLPAAGGEGGPVPGWPAGAAVAPGRAAWVTEGDLPLPDGAVDRVLVVHAAETSPAPKRLLREVWRITADGGRIVVVAPNRRGLWARGGRTPFGRGRPYGPRQLAATLERYLFEPLQEGGALYLPPGLARRWPGLAVPTERLGLRFFRALAGVVMIEARKSVLAPTPLVTLEAHAARRKRYAVVPRAAMVRAERPPIAAREAAVAAADRR